MPTLRELVHDPNTVIVDVRSDWEFESGHVKGALNIPLDQVPSRIAEFKAMGQNIVVYCKSGGRSGMAQGILQQNGVANVFNGGGFGDMQILLM